MKKTRVGIIFGGRSGEHEVSIISAKSVMNAIDKENYEAIPIFINKKGQWLVGLDKNLTQSKGTKQVYLPPDPTHKELISVDKSPLSQGNIDVFFPVLHGTFGEDGSVQGILELCGIPYVGAGVAASAVGMDKDLMKKIFKSVNLPITKYQVFFRSQVRNKLDKIVAEVEEGLKYPVFIKPANLGSSVGISKAHDNKELMTGIKLATKYDRKIIIEEGVESVREIEVAVIGNDYPKTSICGEIVPSREFYDYEDKYIVGKQKLIIPAPIQKNTSDEIRSMARQAFKVIDAAGMARVDFLFDSKNNKIFVSEINTIPGFTSISMYPKLWEKSGLMYQKLIDRLIKLAIEQYNDKAKNKTNFPSKILT